MIQVQIRWIISELANTVNYGGTMPARHQTVDGKNGARLVGLSYLFFCLCLLFWSNPLPSFPQSPIRQRLVSWCNHPIQEVQLWVKSLLSQMFNLVDKMVHDLVTKIMITPIYWNTEPLSGIMGTTNLKAAHITEKYSEYWNRNYNLRVMCIYCHRRYNYLLWDRKWTWQTWACKRI